MKSRKNYKKVKMSEYKKIYQLYFNEHYSLRKIEEILSIPKSTLSDYIDRFLSIRITEAEINKISDQELKERLFPEKISEKETNSYPDFKTIEKELLRPHVTLALLHEEYSHNNPHAFSYSHFCRLYTDWSKSKKITMRQQHIPGEKLFIDYIGDRLPITNPSTGEITQHPLFISCLGFSSYIYIEVSKSQNTLDFCNSIVNNLNFCKGVPKYLVPDNLKSAVITANFYDPKFNLCFQELSDYYKTYIVPARVRKPKDKAKVENSVLVIERWVIAKLRNMIFYSISEANIYIKELLERVNTKIMKKIQKSRKDLFIEYDLKALSALPLEPYIPRLLFKFKVKDDYHIEYLNRSYSVPYKYIRYEVIAHVTNKVINIFYENVLIASHLLITEINGSSTIPEHMPVRHKEVYNNNTITDEALLARAEKIGEKTYLLIKEILDKEIHPVYKTRRCMNELSSNNPKSNDGIEVKWSFTEL